MFAIIALVLIAILAVIIFSAAVHLLFSPWLLLAAVGILLLDQVPAATLPPVAGRPGSERRSLFPVHTGKVFARFRYKLPRLAGCTGHAAL